MCYIRKGFSLYLFHSNARKSSLFTLQLQSGFFHGGPDFAAKSVSMSLSSSHSASPVTVDHTLPP